MILKTNLELELEKAFRCLELPFHEFRTDLLKELLDKDCIGSNCLGNDVPQGICKYLGQKFAEYLNAKKALSLGWNESFAEIICEGMFAKKGSFYKQRFAEINNFIIDYKPVIENIEELEKSYADNSIAEKLIITCMQGGTFDSSLYLLCLSGNVNQLGMARNYKKEYPLFAKYQKGKKLDAKEFVKDLMKMIGA